MLNKFSFSEITDTCESRLNFYWKLGLVESGPIYPCFYLDNCDGGNLKFSQSQFHSHGETLFQTQIHSVSFFDEHSVFFRFDISRLKQLQLGAEYPLSHVHLHLEREQLQMKSLRLGKLIGYQLCRALPQPWGHIGISLVPKNVVRYQSSKALLKSHLLRVKL